MLLSTGQGAADQCHAILGQYEQEAPGATGDWFTRVNLVSRQAARGTSGPKLIVG